MGIKSIVSTLAPGGLLKGALLEETKDEMVQILQLQHHAWIPYQVWDHFYPLHNDTRSSLSTNTRHGNSLDDCIPIVYLDLLEALNLPIADQ